MLKFTLKYLIFAPACFGPGEPKHAGANIRYFNVNLNIFICLIKVQLLVKRNI